MPSTKKRINLTVPDNIYQQLQAYKEEFGLVNDATACLQLIVQQLRSLENSKQMMRFMGSISREQAEELTRMGYDAMKEAMGKQET